VPHAGMISVVENGANITHRIVGLRDLASSTKRGPVYHSHSSKRDTANLVAADGSAHVP